MTDRRRLTRLRRTLDGQPRYMHPHGYTIRRETRDWDARSTGPGGRGTYEGPKNYYFDTLRDARAWCDEHPRA